MATENNIKNKENQEEIPSNNNKQSEEYLKNFKNEVQSITILSLNISRTACNYNRIQFRIIS